MDSGQSARLDFRPKETYQGADTMTFQDPIRLRVPIIEIGRSFFPASMSPQSKAIRGNKTPQLPAQQALGDLPGGPVGGKTSPGMTLAGGMSLELMS